MQRALTHGVVVTVAAIALSGCATKNWVNEMMGKKELQIGERVGRVDARVGETAQKVDTVEGRLTSETSRLDSQLTGVDGRVREVDGRVKESAETAKRAHGRADEAYTRADDVNGRLTRLWAGRHKRDLVETLHVQFAFDRADLSDGAQTALLGVIKELKDNPQLTVDLEGFTDSKGTRDYNIGLSQRRVEAVRRFLIERGADLSRLYSVGLGPLNGGKEEAAKQRRVNVKLMVHSE
jgi:outer membrane protein OmpA-like peptidoglycan-associated protein